TELEIERPQAEVSDADIDAMIDTLRKQRRHFEPVDRAAEKGDFVMFEYAASVGDYRFPEDGLERAGSVLDAGTLFEALEDALIGNKAGDDVKQDIEFPEDFGNKDLAGRKAAEILGDRKSTRLNSSDVSISYPVCYLEHTL